jgi:hypothetical protein
MNPDGMLTAAVPAVLGPRRSDAGSVRLVGRDVSGLVLTGSGVGLFRLSLVPYSSQKLNH